MPTRAIVFFIKSRERVTYMYVLNCRRCYIRVLRRSHTTTSRVSRSDVAVKQRLIGSDKLLPMDVDARFKRQFPRHYNSLINVSLRGYMYEAVSTGQ